MKPLTWLSARSRAQMIEISHHVALPIQRFWPLRTQVSPSRLAVVVSPPLVPDPTSGSVRTEAADLFPSVPSAAAISALLLRAIEIDRAHGEAAVDAEERAERSVGARQLHRDEAEQLLASAGAAIALIAQAAELQFLEGRQQLERKRIIDQYLLIIGWTLVSM